MAEETKKQFIDEAGGQAIVGGLLGLLGTIAESVSALQRQISELPSLPEIPNDGNTYGIRNGVAEIVAGDGEEVLVQDAPTAVSLALRSVQRGELAVAPTDPLFKDMVALIPEDILNDISTQSVATLEVKTPEKSEEEKLQEAIAVYWERKAEREARLAEMQRKRLAEAEKVEPEEAEEV